MEWVFDVFDEFEELLEFELELLNLIGWVEFEYVNFVYFLGMLVICDLLLVVELGSMVVIVGLMGVGKIMLVNLLMWFYEIGFG